MTDLILSKIYVKFYLCQIISSKSLLNQNDSIVTESIKDPKYLKKLFLFNNKIFSKVEIMGKIIGRSIKDQRLILYIDDCTGVIESVVWRNQNETFYQLAEKALQSGLFVRINGNVDYFNSKYSINLDNYGKIKLIEFILRGHQ